MSSPDFDFRLPVAYDAARKRAFHTQARRRLGQLANALALRKGAYDLRTNAAGVAVSGEITLHGERVYVQVSQPFGGFDSGILFRSCTGRKDYTGGRNNFASLDLLHDPAHLAARIRAACHL